MNTNPQLTPASDPGLLSRQPAPRRRIGGRAAILLSVTAAIALILFLRLSRPADPITGSRFLLDTFVTITLYDTDDQSVIDGAMDRIAEYEQRFSKTIDGSEVWQLNHRSPGETTFTLSEDMTAMLSKALHYSQVSEGAYDVTIEPAASLWDFTSGAKTVPDSDALARAAARVDYRQLRLEGNQLTFLSPDTTIDLGSIAKGYIADRVKEYLQSRGVKEAIINLGGNVLCLGQNGRQPFRVGLQKPFADHNDIFGILNIDDKSVVSSGVYERHFIKDGVNYHHILNPADGFPYQNGLIAVTIVSDSSADGDVLSTTCFSLGLEKGLALLDSLDGIAGYFVTDDYHVYYSRGAEKYVTDMQEEHYTESDAPSAESKEARP
jgi:thiamine biosynthesis lipoprotein